MLIDRYLPTYDVTEVCETSLHAPPDVTYAARWVLLAEEPGVELVIGSVGRFWRSGVRPFPS